MQEKKLEMYGGLFGGLIPLIVLVGGLVWLSVAERGGTKPFWACAWIALCVGIFFAKNKEEYCKAAMRGIGDRTGIVIVTAWLLAGVFGKLMAAGGLVQGLLWMGMTTGAQGAAGRLPDRNSAGTDHQQHGYLHPLYHAGIVPERKRIAVLRSECSVQQPDYGGSQEAEKPEWLDSGYSRLR